jgi:hypothetical protein
MLHSYVSDGGMGDDRHVDEVVNVDAVRE